MDLPKLSKMLCVIALRLCSCAPSSGHRRERCIVSTSMKVRKLLGSWKLGSKMHPDLLKIAGGRYAHLAGKSIRIHSTFKPLGDWRKSGTDQLDSMQSLRTELHCTDAACHTHADASDASSTSLVFSNRDGAHIHVQDTSSHRSAVSVQYPWVTEAQVAMKDMYHRLSKGQSPLGMH